MPVVAGSERFMFPKTAGRRQQLKRRAVSFRSDAGEGRRPNQSLTPWS